MFLAEPAWRRPQEQAGEKSGVAPSRQEEQAQRLLLGARHGPRPPAEGPQGRVESTRPNQYSFPKFQSGRPPGPESLVGEMAEDQGHHPDVELSWGRVKLLVWTHKIDGLTESDFIWAAKAEQLQ